jgi:biopolymer transport protein ExbD
MALKKKTKVSAAFSMSAMTDIIFLLLIFFMLTSTIVSPNALNLQLPGQSTDTPPPPPKDFDNVSISAEGGFTIGNQRVDAEQLEFLLSKKAIDSGVREYEDGKRVSNYVITISPHPQAPVESVVKVMDMAMNSGIEAVLSVNQ